MSKPTTEKVLELAEAYEKHWSLLHDAQKEWQTYYNLKNPVKLPEGVGAQVVRGRTAYELVQVGVNNYLHDNPRVEVTPKDEKHDIKPLEAFGNSFLERMIPKIRQDSALQIALGMAVYRIGVNESHLGYNWDSVKDKSEVSNLALTEYPITIRTPHPVNVYPSPYFTNDYMPSAVVEKYKMKVASALGLCEANGWSTSWNKKKDENEDVEFMSYYSDKWRCVTIDDKPVLKPKVAPNILGFCPYIIFPAGMGMLRADGNPVGEYQSILGTHTSSIDFENQLLTHLLAMTQSSAWPQVVIEPDVNTNESYEAISKAVGEELELKPSKAVVTPIGTKLKFLELEGNSMAMVLQALAMIQGQQNSPTGMGGGQMRGVYSGTYANTKIGYEKTWYKNSFKIHEDALALVVGRAYQIIKEVIGHPISVRAIPIRAGEPSGVTKIGPKDIPDYNCKVMLLADAPEASDVKKHIGILAKQAGIIDNETALVEYYDKSSEEAERITDSIMVEKIESLPLPMQALSVKIYEARGEDDMADFIKNMMWEQSRGGSRPHTGSKSEPAGKSVTQQQRPNSMEPSVNPNELGALP